MDMDAAAVCECVMSTKKGCNPANVKETSWPIKIHSNQTMFKTLSALREQRIAAKLVLRSRKAGSRLMVNA